MLEPGGAVACLVSASRANLSIAAPIAKTNLHISDVQMVPTKERGMATGSYTAGSMSG